MKRSMVIDVALISLTRSTYTCWNADIRGKIQTRKEHSKGLAPNSERANIRNVKVCSRLIGSQ